MSTHEAFQTTRLWEQTLGDDSYREYAKSVSDVARHSAFSRAWKRIVKHSGLSSIEQLSVLEIGCGGGKHLAPFALRGASVRGIDCSQAVISNARNFFFDLARLSGRQLKSDFIRSDFFEYAGDEQYDLVFHVGVIEHFLEEADRLEFLRRMICATKQGGLIVSIVPNGMHPMREVMKRECLGGYVIPEIDYSPSRMTAECSSVGLNGTVLAHNLFDHLLLKNKSFLKGVYLGLQLVPVEFFPFSFAARHAGTLVGIFKKL